MGLLDTSFWVFPDPGTVVTAGQALAFEVVAQGQANPAQATAVEPAIRWVVQDTSTDTPKALASGVDYHVVAGSLTSSQLSIVVKPPPPSGGPRTRVSVVPLVTLFAGGAGEVSGRLMPNVVGSAQVAAKDLLEAVGFDVTVRFEPSPDKVGTVIEQGPLAGCWFDPNPVGGGTDLVRPAATVTVGTAERADLAASTAGSGEVPVPGAPLAVSLPKTWAPQQYTLAPTSTGDLERAGEQIANALSLSTDNSMVAPGVAAVLRIAPRGMPLDVPQVVTSIAEDIPEINVRAAVRLDSIVQALLSPVTGAVGRFVPGSEPAVDEAAMQVRDLLGSLFSVPVAVDVLGDRVLKTLAPVGSPQLPLISTSPDGQSLIGTVPIGSWPARFSLRDPYVTWTFENRGDDKETVQYDDLSKGANVLKSFLLQPSVVPLSVGAFTPSTIEVTAVVHLTVDTDPDAKVDVTLPSVLLQRLPIPLPTIGAVFLNSFSDEGDGTDQKIFLTCDPAAAPFVPTLTECVALVSNLSTVLDRTVSVGRTVGARWEGFVDLAAALVQLVDKIQTLEATGDAERVTFRPCWESGSREIDLQDEDWDQVSAVIVIGPKAPGPWFIMSEVSVDGWSVEFGPGDGYRYSSVMPTLSGTWRELEQIPPDSATTDAPSTWDDPNDDLKVLGFTDRVIAEELPGVVDGATPPGRT
jgi:hypothetical protein